MPVTVGVNMLGVVHKSSNGVTIAFPDVCKTPTPAGGIPIPYPSMAKTACEVQTKQTAVKKTDMVSSAATQRTQNTEITQIKGLLNRLNAKLQMMESDDPNLWQETVKEYVVGVSALYVTKVVAHNGASSPSIGQMTAPSQTRIRRI